jgi:hypothetical protein
MNRFVELPNDVFPEVVQEAAEDVKRFTVSQLEDMIDDITTDVPVHSERRLRLGVLNPTEDSDREQWLVMPLPHANTLRPHMLLRAMVLQRVVGNGEYPVAILPNNGVDYNAYSLNRQERGVVATGNLTPVVDQQRFALEDVMSGPKKVKGFGYSLGAMTIAQLAPKLHTVALVSAEAPNAEPDRNSAQLRSDFMAGGNFVHAIADANLPNLTESMHAGDSLKDKAGQLSGLISYALGTQTPINRALHKGMAQNRHVTDLDRLIRERPEVDLTIARAEKSKILKQEDLERLLEVFPEAKGAVLMGYGHEAGDNILQLGSLADLAFNQAA